jgi:hypothetical protein
MINNGLDPVNYGYGRFCKGMESE